MHVGLPDDEMLIARRRIERLVSDAGISDPTELDDGRLAAAVSRSPPKSTRSPGARAPRSACSTACRPS